MTHAANGRPTMKSAVSERSRFIVAYQSCLAKKACAAGCRRAPGVKFCISTPQGSAGDHMKPVFL